MELPEDLCNVNFELDRCFCQTKLKQVNSSSSSSKSENTIGDTHTQYKVHFGKAHSLGAS
jgi:hypothetical protein